MIMTPRYLKTLIKNGNFKQILLTENFNDLNVMWKLNLPIIRVRT